MSPGPRQAIGKIGVIDNKPRAAVREHIGEPLLLLARTERHGNGAEAQCCKQDDGKGNAVAEQHGDPIAFADAGRLQPGGALLHRREQLPIAQTFPAADNRFSVRIARRGLGQQMVGIAWSLHETAHDAIAVMPFVPHHRHAAKPRAFQASHFKLLTRPIPSTPQ